MKPFAAKMKNGSRFLGLGLSDADFLSLKAGNPVTLDLGSIGVGLWVKEADGTRNFIQPRDSKIVLIQGDNNEDIGEFLRISLP